MNELKHLKLLALIIRGDSNKIEDLLKTEDLDFNGFKNFVSANLLAGSVYPILINSQLKSFFPDTLIQHFRLSYMLQWTRNERLIKEIEKLAELFEHAHKEVIFLKGPFFAQRFFGNIDRRPISDIDILAKNEDINDIEQLLARDRYHQTSSILISKNISRCFVHHFEYRKHDIPLELHWVLFRHFSLDLNYRKIWEHKEEFVFNEKLFFLLPGEYELVFQILSILRDIELGDILLKSFQDIYVVLKALNKNANWEHFFDDRKKEGLLSISLNILDLVLSILNCYDEFTALSHYIEENKTYVRYEDMNKKLELLKRSRFAIRNKLWTFTLYDTNRFKAFCWWAVSLPFRLMVHKEQSLKLLTK